MAARRALVLGVTGMVGEPLAQALAADGWAVSGAARFTAPGARERVATLGVEPVAYDMLADDPARLPDVDVLFLEVWDARTSASNDVSYVWASNYHGVGRVVERYAGVAEIVNGCTINVYGDGPEAATEDTPCRPTSEYGRSRFAQERLIDYFCGRGDTRGIHLRYAHANRADRGVVHRMATTILAGETLGLDPDRRVQVIALEDLVRVTHEAATRAALPPAAVNCCHPRVWTQRELAEALHARLGRGQVIFDRDQGGVESSAYADATRMVEWFGPPRVPVEKLLDRVVAALQDSPNA